MVETIHSLGVTAESNSGNRGSERNLRRTFQLFHFYYIFPYSIKLWSILFISNNDNKNNCYNYREVIKIRAVGKAHCLDKLI